MQKPADLLDYGILQEKSDYRVHVCPRVRRVYIYETSNGVKAIESGVYRSVPAFQPNVEGPTAEGFLVPPRDIDGCVEIVLRENEAANFFASDSTSQKGGKAQDLVCRLIKYGGLPIPRISNPVSDTDLDIQGVDIIVVKPRVLYGDRDLTIQVKCDLPGGDKNLGGTGYLFLQTRERNPLRLH